MRNNYARFPAARRIRQRPDARHQTADGGRAERRHFGDFPAQRSFGGQGLVCRRGQDEKSRLRARGRSEGRAALAEFRLCRQDYRGHVQALDLPDRPVGGQGSPVEHFLGKSRIERAAVSDNSWRAVFPIHPPDARHGPRGDEFRQEPRAPAFARQGQGDI